MQTLKLIGDIAIGINIVLIFFNIRLLTKLRKARNHVKAILDGLDEEFQFEVVLLETDDGAPMVLSKHRHDFHAEIAREAFERVYGSGVTFRRSMVRR